MSAMTHGTEEFEQACQASLDLYFEAHPDRVLAARLKKALRILVAIGGPLKGEPAGWAAGLVYWITNEGGRIPCGVPGVLNADLEKCFGITMSTIRKRAAQVGPILTI